jgi:antitoxin component YwqK of YwqJK toxin-antitoxin module
MKRELISLFGSFAFLVVIVIYIFPLVTDENQSPYSEELESIESKGEYDSAGQKINKWIGYYVSGDTAYIGAYSSNFKTGEWRYFDKNGIITKIENYYNGMLEGNVSVYNAGILYDEITYLNGKKNGKHIHYFKNGKVNYIQDYINGAMTGTFVVYYESGRIKQEGRLYKGKNIGEWKMYDKNGNLNEINIYDTSLNSYRKILINMNGDTTTNKIVNLIP